jgi:mRNA-degrading endonuclease RelE of RelBE toxin-antitoxin system
LIQLRHWRILPPSRFIETPTFTRLVYRYLSESAFRDLQLSIVLRPEQGALIPGTRGLRKLRCRGSGRGKRGGLRVIYYWKPDESTCYLLFIYAKSEQGDLTAAQARTLGRLVEREFA